MNYTHITNTPTYTPLNYTYTSADISKEQNQLARDRMAKPDCFVLSMIRDRDDLYKFDGKHYSLRAVK